MPEVDLWKVFVSLGVPGLALGIFYMLFRKFDFKFPSVPKKHVTVIVILFMLLTSGMLFYALNKFGPGNSSVEADKGISFSGVVYLNDGLLPKAEILVINSGIQPAVTNEFGEFTITLPKEKMRSSYKIRVSYTEEVERVFDIDHDKRNNIELYLQLPTITPTATAIPSSTIPSTPSITPTATVIPSPTIPPTPAISINTCEEVRNVGSGEAVWTPFLKYKWLVEGRKWCGSNEWEILVLEISGSQLLCRYQIPVSNEDDLRTKMNDGNLLASKGIIFRPTETQWNPEGEEESQCGAGYYVWTISLTPAYSQ